MFITGFKLILTELLDILSLYAVTAVKLEAHLCSKV